MTRSILWISSRAPSSPFWMACDALPQPQSRTALAADTRAAAVASLLRMMPTRTLSAVLVWLRASERISVIALAICRLRPGLVRPIMFASCYVDVIHDEIVRPPRRPQCDEGKSALLAVVARPRDEPDDLGAHENPSHTAIATRPANASDIRYAVMPASSRE